MIRQGGHVGMIRQGGGAYRHDKAGGHVGMIRQGGK